MTIDSATAYDLHAIEFLRARDRSTIGADVVALWCRSLDTEAEILELACGGGYPITRVLYEAGLQVWAIESSPTLLAEFSKRFPTVTVQCGKVQDSDFFGRNFDAVVAIGLMFLLSESEQIALIHRVAQALKPGARFLFSAPLQSCQWADASTGMTSQSLGIANYETHLHAAGMRLINTFADSGENNYFEAERSH